MSQHKYWVNLANQIYYYVNKEDKILGIVSPMGETSPYYTAKLHYIEPNEWYGDFITLEGAQKAIERHFSNK